MTIMHRDEFPKLMDELGVEIVVEIGSAECWFASKLLASRSLKKLHLVDPWNNLDHWKKAQQFARTNPRVKLHRCCGCDIDIECDMSYIDAMHDYTAVKADMNYWWKRTSKLMAGHDYTMNPLPVGYQNGVLLAVEEFATQIEQPMYVIGAEEPTYLSRLRAATAAAELHDLGPWNSHNPSWYVIKCES